MTEQNELTNEIAQLKDLLPDLNSKLEDIEATLKAEPVSDKVSEHLNKDNKVNLTQIMLYFNFDLGFDRLEQDQRVLQHPAPRQAQGWGKIYLFWVYNL